LVGVTRYDTYPPEVSNVARVGGFVDPDSETVLALHPDLVIGVPTSGGRRRVDLLADLKVPVLIVPGQNLDDLWRAIAVIGTALNRETQATALTARLKGQITQARAEAKKRPPVRVLVLVGRRPIVAVGAGTFLDELLAVLHAQNVVTRGGAYPILDREAVMLSGADVIIDAAYGESPSFDESWRELRAQPEAPRIVELTQEALLRPGPRLGAALTTLGKALTLEHP